MLTKILVTALVIVACFSYLRYQRGKNQATEAQDDSAARNTKKPSVNGQIQWLAVGLIVLTGAAAIGFFIYSWVDDHRVMTVNLINPKTGAQQSYQVYKGDLQERSFKTLQGQQIRIGNTERLEVRESL